MADKDIHIEVNRDTGRVKVEQEFEFNDATFIADDGTVCEVKKVTAFIPLPLRPPPTPNIPPRFTITGD